MDDIISEAVQMSHMLPCPQDPQDCGSSLMCHVACGNGRSIIVISTHLKKTRMGKAKQGSFSNTAGEAIGATLGGLLVGEGLSGSTLSEKT